MSLSGVSIVPHLRCLRAVGFCRLRPARGKVDQSERTQRQLHRGYHAFALLVTSTYVLQQLIYAYQEKHDMEKLSKVLFIVLCHVTCVAKQIVFHRDAERIDRLIISLDDPLFNSNEHPALLTGTASSAARLLRWYTGCAIATCVLWIVFPILNRLQRQTVEFPFWTGFDYQHTLLFALVTLYSFYATNLVAIGNTTMDAFMATIFYQCKTQLQILRINLECLPQKASLFLDKSGSNYDTVMYKLFVEYLIHYKKITECCELLQDVFSEALLVQFGVGGWILCMAAYKIVSVPVLSFEFASTTLFIICILTELLLYCYYGNEVAVESDRVVESMYSMEWSGTPLHFQRTLFVAMERAKRPLRPAAGFVIPLTLETYVKILKSSYSFYAVLRQIK